MPAPQNIIAIVYDYDQTLSPNYMQDEVLFPKFGIDAKKFWARCHTLVKEEGYDIELSSLRGMVAPKGLPPEIRERLVKAIQSAVADPEFQARAVQFFSPLRYLAPAQYEGIVREADVTYRALWKELPWADK